MKQKVFNLLWIVLCCLNFMACNVDKTELTPDRENDILQLRTATTGLTRANDNGFEIGDSLGIYAVKWKSSTERNSLFSNTNYADNICFRLEGPNQNWIPDHMIYYPNDDNKIDLYAYYSYRAPAIDKDNVVRLYLNKKLVQEKQGDFELKKYTNVVLFGSPKYSDGNGLSILKEMKVYKGTLTQEQINKL